MNNSSDYYKRPPFDQFAYSTLVQAYYIASGGLAMLMNGYLIVLFVLYKKLRLLQCNWLIAYLSFVEIFIGLGTLIHGALIVIAFNFNVVYFDFIPCSIFVHIIFAACYRLEQTIALMIAADRLIAIKSPMLYNKYQCQKISLFAALISSILFALLSIASYVNVDKSNIVNLKDISRLTLDQCVIIITSFWYRYVPIYSISISIVFFVVYLTSLILFWRFAKNSKRSQHPNSMNPISKMQSRVFVTVSLALCSMTVFYVVPTMMQLMGSYFSFAPWLNIIGIAVIQYGAEFNGILNAIIYLTKHQEFRESSKRLFCKVTGKVTPFENKQTNRISNLTRHS